MLKQITKLKKKNVIFVCQVTDTYLKLIKFQLNFKKEFLAQAIEDISSGVDDKKLSEKLSQILKKLGYKNNLIIISLSRNLATCRHLRVPTQSQEEMERIISLQAPRYLPYPADELITGYQVISTDKEGYAELNLVIVHKDIIQRYIKIFQGLNIKNFKLTLNSYGLFNLYNYIQPDDTETAMLIDIDYQQVELTVVSNKRLLFSRYFKFNPNQPNWENLFMDELKKSQDAYLKELSKEAPRKIIVLAAGRISGELKDALNKRLNLPVEFLSYLDNVSVSAELRNIVSNSHNSFSSLIGLALKDIEESLNLVPSDLKGQSKLFSLRKERIRLSLFIACILLLLGSAIAKSLDNKAMYLKQLKMELKKIEKDAQPLEEIEKRFKLLESHLEKKTSGLDVLYELSQVQPAQISLINFIYEEDNQVILRGQTAELNSIFLFVAQLEKSKVFKNFNIKVRYATKKKMQTGEIVDFEIVCLKK